MDSPAPSKLAQHGGKRVKGEQACDARLTYGTVAYWLARLEREGRADLIEAIRERRVSAHAVACQLGWIKRRPTGVIDGDHNLTRRREYEMACVLGPAFASQVPCFNCKEACAWRALQEIDEAYAAMQRGEPVRRSGNGVWPPSCCRRQITRVDARALVG